MVQDYTYLEVRRDELRDEVRRLSGSGWRPTVFGAALVVAGIGIVGAGQRGLAGIIVLGTLLTYGSIRDLRAQIVRAELTRTIDLLALAMREEAAEAAAERATQAHTRLD